MSAVIQSLKVEGNVPCPVPADSGKPPPSIARRKVGSAKYVENHSAKPVKVKSTLGPRINTEEDLKSIMLQAKTPPIIGPTAVTKRFTYLSKLKQLNDGMYRQTNIQMPDANPPQQSNLKLEGRKMEEVQGVQNALPEGNMADEELPVSPTLEVMVKSSSPDKNVRNSKSSLSAKSARSVKSIQSSKSDPAPTKSMMLPSLTIGASRPMTRGEYILESKGDTELYSLGIGSPNKDALRGEQDDYEFRFHTPRKLHLRLDSRDGKTTDSTGNYGSLSLSDLKACLHVNNHTDKSRHQEDIVQGYIKQFKSSRTNSRVKVNAYKMLKNSPRVQTRAHSPRYHFKNVDSYLKFNRDRDTGNLAKTITNSAIHGEQVKPSYSDTVVLKVVSDLNTPQPSRNKLVTTGGNRIPEKVRDDVLKAKQMNGIPSARSRNNSAKLTESGDTEVLQHIIYVPSGQTAKVRLLKS